MSHHRLPDPKGRPREVAIGLVILTVLAGVVVTRGGLPSASYADAGVEGEVRITGSQEDSYRAEPDPDALPRHPWRD